MADEEAEAANSFEEDEIVDEDDGDDLRDLRSLLTSEDRDFLVRNNGDMVKISDLEGKTVGLYFSGSWCGPCRRFTPILVEAYTELASKYKNFEIVFVSSDEDDEDFDDYFSEMPWLAVPFSDEDKRDSLSEEFNVEGIPTLVIIDKNGEVLTDEAVQVVRDYGAEGYPFTDERITKLKEEEEEAKMNQTIKSLLVTTTRDFLFTSNFKKVPVSELEGKIVGLYFSLSSFEACAGFTRRLINVYNDLKGRGENFEIVLVSLEEDETSFMDDFEDMPWFGIPFKDKLCEKLVRYFELEDLPSLVVIGSDGKTVNVNAVELVEDYGVESYPFTSKKLRELKRKEKARIENQTLESLFILGEKDFVIKNDGSKVPVSDLAGMNILLYFSAHWCPPCRAFLPHLIEVYNNIKERDAAFEIIFISSDEDEVSFDEYFLQMPWLALPFWDERKRFLARVFKISGIPSCVAVSPTGKMVTKEARSLIIEYGANAYPFTKEKIVQLKAEMEEKAKNWPEKIRHKVHRHVLLKCKKEYICDSCGKRGRDWSFYCKKCNFDLDPCCALDDHEEVESEDDDEEAEWPKKIKHLLHKHPLVKAWRHYQCDSCGEVKHGWSYFCEVCDFDLHPECALGNIATFKEIDDSGDEFEFKDEDEVEEEEDDTDVEDYGKIDDEAESLQSSFKQELKLRKHTDGDDVEDKESNLENVDDNKYYGEIEEDEGERENYEDNMVEDESKKEEEESKKESDDGDVVEDEDEEDKEGDEDSNENDEYDEDDDEDGPGMKGYACNTRDRESSVSFQESLFTCKLYK